MSASWNEQVLFELCESCSGTGLLYGHPCLDCQGAPMVRVAPDSDQTYDDGTAL